MGQSAEYAYLTTADDCDRTENAIIMELQRTTESEQGSPVRVPGQVDAAILLTSDQQNAVFVETSESPETLIITSVTHSDSNHAAAVLDMESFDCTALELEPSSNAPTPTTLTQKHDGALVRTLRMMKDQRRRLITRQRVAVVVGALPVTICSLEMIPDRCRICRQDVQMDAYIFTAAICGGFAAVIYGKSLEYWMPRLVGGASAALGTLCTNWVLLSSIPSKWAFLLIVLGALGAMPGLVIYFSLKIIADECFASDAVIEDEYEEIAPLTKIRMVSGD
jgi:hypothetical protein